MATHLDGELEKLQYHINRFVEKEVVPGLNGTDEFPFTLVDYGHEGRKAPVNQVSPPKRTVVFVGLVILHLSGACRLRF